LLKSKHNKVIIGSGAKIGKFSIIGELPRDKKPGQLKTQIGKNALIRSHSVIYAGNVIGDNFETGHAVNIREHNQIGDNVSIGTHSVIEHHVKIGHRVRIHSQVFIAEYSVIEKDVWIGPAACLLDARYPVCIDSKEHLQGSLIKKGAIIGAGTIIMPGIIIGKQALIGAGAVVTKNIPDGKVAIGNPAKIYKDRSELKTSWGKPYDKI